MSNYLLPLNQTEPRLLNGQKRCKERLDVEMIRLFPGDWPPKTVPSNVEKLSLWQKDLFGYRS